MLNPAHGDRRFQQQIKVRALHGKLTAEHSCWDAGRKSQYIYMPVNDSIKANSHTAAIKVSTSSQEVVGRLSFGEQCYGGELVFVPRHQDTSALQGRLLTSQA